MSRFVQFYSDRSPVTFRCVSKSKTEQSHRDSCDINRLVDRYKKTGIISDPSVFREQFYGDFHDVPDMVELSTARARLAQYFEGLPSATRAAFENSPDKLIAAFDDPSKKDLLLQHGFLKKAPAPSVGTPERPVDMTISPEAKAAADSAQATP